MLAPVDNEPIPFSDDVQTWGPLIHLSAFSLFFTGIGYLLGPLIIWLLKRPESSFIDDQGKEVLNFQLTSTFYFILTTALCFILNVFLLLYFLLIAWMVLVIQAAQAANDGRKYRYPFTLRLVR